MEDLINQVKAELKIDDKKKIPIDDRSITQDELYDTLKMFQNDRHFTYLPIPFKMYKDFSCFDKMTIGTLTGTTNELPVHSLEDTFIVLPTKIVVLPSSFTKSKVSIYYSRYC